MLATHDPRHIRMQWRPGTQDALCFQEVIVQNQYRLADHLSQSDIILDVGANIGCFAVACVTRGAGRVLCYEPDAENFRYLQQNVGGMVGVRCEQKAVWGGPDRQLFYTGYPPKATACGSVMDDVTVGGMNSQIPVEHVQLDSILAAIEREGRHVSLLKIDAEGAEYPILYTSQKLDLVDSIVGEVHNMGLQDLVPGYTRYDKDELASVLEEKGFDVELEQASPCGRNWLFWARR